MKRSRNKAADHSASTHFRNIFSRVSLHVSALYDPGWNDPPSYSYDARKTKSKGYSLTKRVAYSLDDTEQQPKQVTLTIPPKMCPADHPPIIPMNKPSAGILHETTNNEAETVVECSSVLGNFFVVLNEVYGDANEVFYEPLRCYPIPFNQ